MIANMRHKLVLSLYSTIGLAGLVAAALGLFGAGGILLISLAAAGGAAAGAVNGIDTGFRFDFALMLAGGWLLLAGVGGVVAWFGLTTWYRRRKDGPAPDSASVAKTPFGKVVAVLIFGGFAIYAGVTLFYMFGAYGRDAMLAASGVTVEARITGYVPAPEVHPDIIRVHYAFTTPNGEIIEDSRNQWSWQVDQLKKTGTGGIL